MTGRLVFSRHARDVMARRHISEADVEAAFANRRIETPGLWRTGSIDVRLADLVERFELESEREGLLHLESSRFRPGELV